MALDFITSRWITVYRSSASFASDCCALLMTSRHCTPCRAPPFPDQLPDRCDLPTISSRVCSVGPSYFRLLPCQASREIQEAYDGETSFVRVLSLPIEQMENFLCPGARALKFSIGLQVGGPRLAPHRQGSAGIELPQE